MFAILDVSSFYLQVCYILRLQCRRWFIFKGPDSLLGAELISHAEQSSVCSASCDPGNLSPFRGWLSAYASLSWWYIVKVDGFSHAWHTFCNIFSVSIALLCLEPLIWPCFAAIPPDCPIRPSTLGSSQWGKYMRDLAVGFQASGIY